jgi:hypothetical protein
MVGTEFLVKLHKMQENYSDLNISKIEYDWFTYILSGGTFHGLRPLVNGFDKLAENIGFSGKLCFLWNNFNVHSQNIDFSTFISTWMKVDANNKVTQIHDIIHDLNCNSCCIAYSYYLGLCGRFDLYQKFYPGLDKTNYHVFFLIGQDKFLKLQDSNQK